MSDYIIYICVYNIIILYIYTSFPHKTLGGRNLAAPRSRHWSALHLVSRPSAWIQHWGWVRAVGPDMGRKTIGNP